MIERRSTCIIIIRITTITFPEYNTTIIYIKSQIKLEFCTSNVKILWYNKNVWRALV